MTAPKGFTEINGTVLSETEMAIMVDFGMTHNVWLPKSQLEDWPDINKNGDVLMPEWLAEEKDLI